MGPKALGHSIVGALTMIHSMMIFVEEPLESEWELPSRISPVETLFCELAFPLLGAQTCGTKKKWVK